MECDSGAAGDGPRGLLGYTVTGNVAVLMLSSPATRNALSTNLLRELCSALDDAEGNPDVRCLLLTGGERLFASGADVRELRDLTPAAYAGSERAMLWSRILRFSKPSVAAVAGYVLGGGCELALTCDIIVAADTAVFGQPEIKLGLMPGAGGTQRWGRAAGRFRAAEVVLTGQQVDAWTAHRWGIVSRVVPAESVVASGLVTARTVAAQSPTAAGAARAAIRAGEEIGMTAALAQERALFGTVLSTEDHLEGIDAFLEKRPPRFRGW